MFSVFASHLRKVELPTFEKMLLELASIKLKSSPVIVKEMEYTSDFVSKIASQLLHIEGHSSFAQFRFRRESKVTKMHVKVDELCSTWQFGAGIKLFDVLPDLRNIPVASFRENNEYSDIFRAVWTKYIPSLTGKMSNDEIEDIKSKWEARVNRLIELDVRRFTAFDISTLKPQDPVKEVEERPCHSSGSKEPSLTATFYPLEMNEFHVEDLITDCSLVMYTLTKVSRPWIGLYVGRSKKEPSKICVQWLKKDKKFYVLESLNNGSPYISDVEVESIMFSNVLSNVSRSNDRKGPYVLSREAKKLIQDAYIERDNTPLV